MQIDPYLNFNGQCEAAFRFYERCLGGKIEFMATFGESPMAGQFPPEFHGKIMHVRMSIGDRVLMASDCPPDRFDGVKGFSVSIAVSDPAEAERIFAALSEGGHVSMPIQETFWAQRFGMATDRFGIPWMINCEKKA